MSNESYRLWETTPAAQFAEAHLLGNGRLGAAVFGTAPDESIVINEDTLWSGSESSHVNKNARMLLPEAKRLIFEHKFVEANRLVNERMLGIWMQSYQPLGTLYVSTHAGGHPGSEYLRRAGGISRDSYRRTLDLDTAIETIEYREDGRWFRREYFVSAPAQVLAVRFSVDSGVMNCCLAMNSLLRHTVSVAGETLLVAGRAPDHVEPSFSSAQPSVVYLPDDVSKSIRFAAVVRVVETDGVVTAGVDRLSVDGARSIVFLLAAHTNYSGYLGARDTDTAAVAAKCRNTIAAAGASSWEKIREQHVDEHGKRFRRVGIEIGPAVPEGRSTSERMALQADTEDPSFAALALQYTRYLIIAGSRPGTQAANLQGIWNHLVQPAWSSNYTTNINVQMNYWGAEVLNLSECHGPMLDLVAESAESGRKTAADWYGLDGWVVHHNIDLWRSTWPSAGFACWAWWPMAAGWLCRHLWQHFEYGGDMKYLAEFAYPLMEDAARFLLSSLVEDEEGYLSTAPSTSPENSFFPDEGGQSPNDVTTSVSKSSTMDLSIIRELFENCGRAAELLGVRSDFHDRLDRAIKRLYPFKVGGSGQLQEWCFEFRESNPGMGHVSHMYGLYPGNLFTPRRNPELYEACRKSMLRRYTHGAFGGGWPASWAISLFARLKEQEICGLIAKGIYKGLGTNFMTTGSLQMDCVFGLGAGIAEMLIQSHDGRIELLPALPPSWSEGRVSGLVAVGGFEVSIRWEAGRLVEGDVRSLRGGVCRLSAHGLRGIRRGEKQINVRSSEDGTFEFTTEPGVVYKLDMER